LNFGNPKKPEMFWQFKEAVRGIGDACTELETPVTGGNVSFYNESPEGPIYPSPVIGMLGLIEDARLVVRGGFQHQGDQILLLGHTVGHIGGTEYLKVIHSVVAGDAPPIDLVEEKRLQEALLALCRAGLLQSAHDLSEGGIAVALAESCLFAREPGSMRGARINLEKGSRDDYMLFGEDQSRVLISVSPAALDEVQSVLTKFRVRSTRIGSVGGRDLVINDRIRVSVSEMGEVYESALEKRLGIEPGA
jgi:phosphoribosylformylglycinamidine synthase